MAPIQRKLTAILAADVHQFSKMMGEDEVGTLASLRACREIVDAIVAEHHGRIFGSAGDSVLAEFASAVSAVLCAVACQQAIAHRNVQLASLPGHLPLVFRIGINSGDVIVEGDNLYGDGVNVAARLEAVATPGAICVSAKVYDEVRRKLSNIAFVDGGAQKLKNIEDPVVIYHVGSATAGVAPAATPAAAVTDKPLIAVEAIRVISGDDEVKALAEGLFDAIGGALARSTALAVKAGDPAGADFQLKGSLQAAGKRLRLSLVLGDAAGRQIWTERYDRVLDDVFGLQDEIALHVSAAIRIHVKTQLFERLRSADNATLAVPQLLDKAAGIFVRGLDRAGDAVPTLRLAIERAPENSMAWAMLGFALFRIADYRAEALEPAIRDEIVGALDNAVALDPRSYFARSIKALALHDLLGDSRAAHEQASEALGRNANFIPAQAMLGIAEIHLGAVEAGLRRLQEAMTASPEDASHHRHRRELAIGHLMAGNATEGLRVATKLWEDAPDMKRNALVLAGLMVAAGDIEAARRQVAALRSVAPHLALATARLPRIGDPAAAERFRDFLNEAGLQGEG
jgi:class 3 adenylate cyclase/tetratricopeptide (TPR) repeat protein